VRETFLARFPVSVNLITNVKMTMFFCFWPFSLFDRAYRNSPPKTVNVQLVSRSFESFVSC